MIEGANKLMNSITTAAIEKSKNVGIVESPFLAELVRQVRLQDRSGIYSSWSNELLLKSFVIPGDSCQLPIDSPGNYLTNLGISAFYHAVAAIVEKETGQLAQIFINLSHQGLSSALVCCGPLLVVSRLLRDGQEVGFDSLETLAKVGEEIAQKAISKVRQYFDFSASNSTRFQQT